jgi:hypothetical protein
MWAHNRRGTTPTALIAFVPQTAELVPRPS